MKKNWRLLMEAAHPSKNLQSDQREPAWSPAVSAAEMPHDIFHYVLETSGWHQLWLVVLTVVVFLIEIVPLELQRRIVNDLTKHRNFSLIIVLCAVYAGTVLLQGGVKLVLNIYRSWVGERAIRDLRRRVHVLVSSSSAAASGPEAEGIQASMIIAEVESIGAFIGGSISEPLLQGGPDRRLRSCQDTWSASLRSPRRRRPARQRTLSIGAARIDPST